MKESLLRPLGFLVLLTLVCLEVAGCAAERALVGAGASVPPRRAPDKMLSFKNTPQGELKMHIYLPPEWKPTDRRPAIVFWFGGGFVGGSPSQFYSKAEYLAGRGLVCACAEYRVKNIHGTGIEKCIEDARSAMRWVKIHSGELGIDPGKVIASGGSAGGTLAILVAAGDGPDAPGEDTKVSPQPCALVLFNPAQGLPPRNRAEDAGENREDLMRQLTALNEPRKGMVPAIFFFGTADRLGRFSREYCEKSLALGNRCEFWSAEGMPHGFFNRQPWHDATLRKADEFLVSLGYLKGEPTLPLSDSAVLKRELPRKAITGSSETPR